MSEDTPATVDQAAEPQSDLWTADSERDLGTSDPLPSGAVDTETPEPDSEPAGADPKTDPTTSTERDEAGKFKPKGKGKPRTDPQARVQAATAKEAAAKEETRLAREEAAALKTKLADLEQRQTPPAAAPSPAVAPPSPEPFPVFDAWLEKHPGKDWLEYLDERTNHLAEQRWQSYQAQQTRTQRLTAYQARLADAAQKDPTYAATIQAGDVAFGDALTKVGLQRIPEILVEAVVDSPRSAELLLDFSTHPEAVAQLAAEVQSLPVSAVSVVRRLLEARLSPTGAVARPDSASVVRPSAAKPPVNRVGGTANAQPADPEDLEFGPEYIRLENQRERKQREAGRW